MKNSKFVKHSVVQSAKAMAFALLAGSAFCSLAGMSLKAHASTDVSLEDQLKMLSLPENQAPAAVSTEKLYSVQSRYNPLRGRSEVAVFAGMNLTADSFTQSQEVAVSYRYHLSDRWNLGLSGSYTFNALSTAGERLLAENQMLPDSVLVKNRADLLLGYNVFYGKFRLSMDQVLYFDQYVAVGPGLIRAEGAAGNPLTNATAGVADIGFAFWMGQHTSVRLGFKNFVFREQRVNGSGLAHHMLGHLDVGYVF
jgi:outer membrane beta-barrel protein